MDKTLLVTLVLNASLLLALNILHEISFQLPRRLLRATPYLNGILIGMIGMTIMSIPFTFPNSIFFDTRSILISVSALVFGPIPSTVAAAILVVFRLLKGNIGAIMGVATIVGSWAIGLLVRQFLYRGRVKFQWLPMYVFGFGVHLYMLGCTILLPASQAAVMLRAIALPVLLVYPAGSVLLTLTLLHQIERSEAAAHIAEAESRYRSMFEGTGAVMMLVDPQTQRILDVNPAAEGFYGWPVSRLRGMPVSRINMGTGSEIGEAIAQAAAQEGRRFRFRHARADGSEADVEVYSGPILLHGRTVLFSIIHDISDRVASERERDESEARFRSVVEGSPFAIFIQLDGRFAYVNPAGCRLFGADSIHGLLGSPVYERYHPDNRDLVLSRIQELNEDKHSVPEAEETVLQLDGSPVPVVGAAVPIRYQDKNGAIVFLRDISRQKQLEAEKIQVEAALRQRQKLEAIGTLAGGVAHEINNPVNGIMNYAQLILDELDTPAEGGEPRVREYAGEILHETDRVSAIVRGLLQFSRQERQSHSPASVEEILGQTISLIRTIFRKDHIELELHTPDGLPQIKCRSQQIQQVLMNLLTNARDALNERYPDSHPDKVVRIDTSMFMEDGRRWIRIAVEDHGAGIPPDVREKIFEPFFSTKPKEKGTGLGLSISFGIVQDHHGRLSAESIPDTGTRFLLDLPVDNGWALTPESLQTQGG